MDINSSLLMNQSTGLFTESENFRGLFCKLNVVYPVTDKYPKPDESSPHTQLHFSTVYCVCVVLSEKLSFE